MDICLGFQRTWEKRRYNKNFNVQILHIKVAHKKKGRNMRPFSYVAFGPNNQLLLYI